MIEVTMIDAKYDIMNIFNFNQSYFFLQFILSDMESYKNCSFINI